MGLWLCHTCTIKEKLAKEKEAVAKSKIKEATPETESEPQPSTSEVESQTPPAPVSEEPVEQVETIETLSPVVDVDVEMKESESTTPSSESEPMIIEEIAPVKEEEEKVEEQPQEPEKEPEKEEEPVVPEQEEELSPFQELVRVASLLNPKQFELPVEMTEPFPFPGTDRVDHIKNGRRVKTKRLVELDSHGCVSLPAKLCFSCKKSCKRAPLISCDYCSLYFHQDCLDPPMTALPAGRWMCPNHPQHFIVSSCNSHDLNDILIVAPIVGLEFSVVNIGDRKNEDLGSVWNGAT